MQYKGFFIQRGEYGYFVRDSTGAIRVQTETEKAARKWIDENT